MNITNKEIEKEIENICVEISRKNKVSAVFTFTKKKNKLTDIHIKIVKLK